ncbi:MAG: tRNA (uridine(34)/cytosine(34)/5-carboxymethylaminomethyluridine(34)-2'-O)-methyltransferase TrmL [SAR86 cluster bacterium]|uniref:tRNA (cytidine(34)-2'-O)-methyltransferase n=1 Tax=SAR86 cluster bacterium TaxID=2030880 RepID=A0A2A5AU31_9GAMM|nr:MAG: tRNA (uridine(34)/cytosine(34)/5-carboxymethylaminomethyluridine(34)-2'-O)-methyltransferase TrmL [SAR86 cluster bacterium]
MINIVLFEPEIPPNTGNIIRLAANTGTQLHLIKPFGFELDDKRMRRAGLDYHEFAGVSTYENWQEFAAISGNEGNISPRMFGISTKGETHYDKIQFRKGDFLVFGPETRGLPDSVRSELGKENLIRIPMLPESRSLNLSNAVAVVVYEAWRQLGFVSGD